MINMLKTLLEKMKTTGKWTEYLTEKNDTKRIKF